MPEPKIDKNKKDLQFKLAVLRYYKFVTVLIIIVLIGLSYYFILEPKYQQVGIGGKYNIDTLKQELIKRQNYLDNLKKLAANYQNISQTEMLKLNEVLPEEEDIPGLFVQLQNLAQENNLLLASVSINETSGSSQNGNLAGNIKKLSVSLNLIGGQGNSYNEVKQFLSALEYNLRIFDVNSVYFSPDSPSYTINIFTYYYKNN
ncbi:MAG: type 4a pilus biogenesis protein PilO [Candidatus Buchananbacteria bacterium]